MEREQSPGAEGRVFGNNSIPEKDHMETMAKLLLSTSGDTVLASKAILVHAAITEYHRPVTLPESGNPTSRHRPSRCLLEDLFPGSQDTFLLPRF